MLQSLKASKDTVATDAFSWIEELSTSPDATMWKFTQLHDAQQVALLQQLSQVDAMKLTKTIEALPASQQEHLALAVRRSPLAAAAGGPPSSWVAALQAQSGSLDASVASKGGRRRKASESREGSMMLGPYPGYNGTLNVTGEFGVSYIGVSAKVWFSIAGLEADNCQTIKACGIHIHKGETCSDAAQVGAHDDDDPWESVTYSINEYGKVKGERSINIGSGLDISDSALVVHDSTGARIACGRLPLYTGTGPSFCGGRTVKQDEAAGVKLCACNMFISGPDCGHEVFGDNAFGECKTEDSPTRLRICNTLNNTDACAASSITSLETCAAKVREMVDAGLCHEYGQFYTSFYLSSTPAKPSCVCRYPSTTMGEVKVTGAKNSLLWALA